MTGGIRRREILAFAAMLAIALIAFLPLRVALGVAGIDGLSAREVVGPVWWGGLGEARVGKVAVGDVSAGVAPLPLLLGRARIDVAGRERSANASLRGALTLSGKSGGMDKVTAHLAVDGAFAPLPVDAVDLDGVTVRFRDGACRRASGRVTATLATATMPALSLPQKMRGDARCAGGALEIPLASAAGSESILLSIRLDGHYRALLTIRPGDAQSAAALTGSGFQKVGDGYRLAVTGSF